MNISNPAKPVYPSPDASRSAVAGIRAQLARLDQNLANVAQGERSNSFTEGSRDRALVEQHEIVDAVRANARSLETAKETLGTILDIKV